MTGPVAAEAVLDHIPPYADLIVSMANGEPVGLIDVLEAHQERLHRVRIHQMHALHPRPSIEGKCGDHPRHVSYFLSSVTRPVLLGRYVRPGAQPLLRDAPPATGRDEVLARAVGGEPVRPPRLLQPRHQRVSATSRS